MNRSREEMLALVERAYREGYDDGWSTGTAAMQADRAYNADGDWKRFEARTLARENDRG